VSKGVISEGVKSDGVMNESVKSELVCRCDEQKGSILTCPG